MLAGSSTSQCSRNCVAAGADHAVGPLAQHSQAYADPAGCCLPLQADSGAQAVQIFDSWASHLSPQDFDVFAGPYIKQIISSVKQTHPDLPIILYISGSGGLLERMAACSPDIISIDQSVDLVDGIKRVGTNFAIQVRSWGSGARGAAADAGASDVWLVGMLMAASRCTQRVSCRYAGSACVLVITRPSSDAITAQHARHQCTPDPSIAPW